MGMFDNKDKKEIAYEGFMILLACFSIGTLWYNTDFDGYIVWGTWAVFFVDFVFRFFKSSSKLEFLKTNPFLVIAAIPLDAVFQFARFARILHLLRLKTITKYYTMPVIQLLKKQNIIVVVTVAFLLVFLSIIPLYLFEPDIDSYWQAFLTSMVTAIFFGQGDFNPNTIPGHTLTIILSVIGVIMHGFILSTAVDTVFHSKWFQKRWKKVKGKFK